MRKEQFDKILLLKDQVNQILLDINTILNEDGRPINSITMDDVIKEICDYGRIKESEFTKYVDLSRPNRIAIWRKIACYILLNYTKVPIVVIKRRIGYTSNGSHIVRHHADNVETWMKEPRFAPKDFYISTKNILINLGYETV